MSLWRTHNVQRDMGKAFFADIQDDKGRIQLYVRVNELGEEAFAEFKMGHRRYCRRGGFCVPHPPGRNQRPLPEYCTVG